MNEGECIPLRILFQKQWGDHRQVDQAQGVSLQAAGVRRVRADIPLQFVFAAAYNRSAQEFEK